jgi:hypothetical protein
LFSEKIIERKFELDVYQIKDNTKSEVILTADFKYFYSCEPVDTYDITRCFQVECDKVDLSKANCFNTVKRICYNLEGEKGSRAFKWKLKTKEKVFIDENYPACHLTNDWNSINIGKSIEEWKNYLLINQDPFWHQDSNENPFDDNHPMINIQLSESFNRKQFSQAKYSIRSFHGKELLRGTMTGGKIVENVDRKIAILSDWKSTIVVTIGTEHSLEIVGRLKRGKLHGMTIFKGIFSNNPLGR